MTALSITLALVAVVAAALAALALVAWRRTLAAASRRDEAADRELAELAELRERLAVLERATSATRGAGGGVDEREFVITRLGESAPEPAGADRLPVKVSLTGPAFADVVVRETVVQTASLVHGLRRALSPEIRHRIRLEMKRELKRRRKARRVEVKAALREYRARHRAAVDAAGSAAPTLAADRTEDVA